MPRCPECVILHLSAINKPLFWKLTPGCPAAPPHVPLHTQRGPSYASDLLSSAPVGDTPPENGRVRMSHMLTDAWTKTTSLFSGEIITHVTGPHTFVSWDNNLFMFNYYFCSSNRTCYTPFCIWSSRSHSESSHKHIWLLVFQLTSSKRRPDDPPYGLDPVVHICLGVGHEQEGLMADWCTVLFSGPSFTDRWQTSRDY